MAPDKIRIDKIDTSAPLQKRNNYLKVTEQWQLVAIDQVEEIDNDRGDIDPITGKIKKTVRVHCREIILKEDRDASGQDDTHYEYFPQQEPLIKDSVSTSSWYLLADYNKTEVWPKEGIFYTVWKNDDKDGIRWEPLA